MTYKELGATLLTPDADGLWGQAFLGVDCDNGPVVCSGCTGGCAICEMEAGFFLRVNIGKPQPKESPCPSTP